MSTETTTIRLSDRVELVSEPNGDVWLVQDGVHRTYPIGSLFFDALVSLVNPPRYDLPTGVIAGSDGKFYAPGDVVRTLPDEMWTRHAFGQVRDWLNRDASNHLYEVRPTAANQIPTLPPFTFKLPDGELACYRRDAAKLREAGARVLNTQGNTIEARCDSDHPSMVLLVEFPAQPKTDVIPTGEAYGRVLPSGERIKEAGEDDGGPFFLAAPGNGRRVHCSTVEVLATDGAP